MAWVNEDRGATWQHHPLNVRDLSYAPTTMHHRGRFLLMASKDQWSMIIDRSQSTDDFLVDYRECSPTSATRVRLIILQWPTGITPAVSEFTLFGQSN